MAGSFEIVFNVPMECEGCEDTVRNALKEINGIERFEVNWQTKVLSVFGSVAPSEIVSSLREVGKDAIIRGTGAPNSAAVSILETYHGDSHSVNGLARIVAIDEGNLVVDLSISDDREGVYYPQIRSSGDLSEGAFSTGKVFHSFEPITLHKIKATQGSLQRFLEAPLRIQDVIGRSFVLTRGEPKVSSESMCGVVARSAGAWENDKYICACSGKTVWQERSDALARGILS